MAPSKNKVDDEALVQAIVDLYNNDAPLLKVVKKYCIPLRTLKNAVSQLIEINEI